MRYRASLATATITAALCLVPAAAYADVTISYGDNQNENCSSGTCAPTAADAVLNYHYLQRLLASGNVVVTTTGSGVQAGNILIDAPLAWSTSGALTLDAYQSVQIDKYVSITGLSGLTLLTNDGGQNGVLSFGYLAHVSISNLSTHLTINGAAYKLVDSVASLASAVAKNGYGNYALAKDYDASGDGTYSSSPVGVSAGNFEGLGNRISNLKITDTQEYASVGLFAGLSGYVSIENLRLFSVNVHGGAVSDVGGIVGDVYKATLSGDAVTGTVRADASPGGYSSYVGGVVGQLDGFVSSCASAASIYGGQYATAGGLVGVVNPSVPTETIANSHATGSVTVAAGAGDVSVGGGLVGTEGPTGMIVDSYATGKVAGGDYTWTGGLLGFNFGGKIDSSFALGSVTSGNNSWAGGLIGEDTGNGNTNSYAEGAVTAGSNSGAGGLFGTSGAATRGTYSIGPARAGSKSLVGGVVGQVGHGGAFRFTYWDTTTSGNKRGNGSGSARGIGALTTSQLQAGLPRGFDSAIWAEDTSINGGLPYLIANPPAS